MTSIPNPDNPRYWKDQLTIQGAMERVAAAANSAASGGGAGSGGGGGAASGGGGGEMKLPDWVQEGSPVAKVWGWLKK